QLVRIVGILWRQGDPDGGADDDLVTFDLERCVQGFEDTTRQLARLLRIRYGGLDDGKFVAAETRQRVDVADASSEALRDGPQYGVANGVTERIVGFLEVVEIDTEYREAF